MLRRLFDTIWVYAKDKDFRLFVYSLVLGGFIILLFWSTSQPKYAQTPIYH